MATTSPDAGGAIYSQAPPSGNAAAIYNPIASATQPGSVSSGRSQGVTQPPLDTAWNDPPLLKSKRVRGEGGRERGREGGQDEVGREGRNV